MPQIFSLKNDILAEANTVGTNHCFAAVAKKIKQPIIEVTRLIRVEKIYYAWLKHRLKPSASKKDYYFFNRNK